MSSVGSDDIKKESKDKQGTLRNITISMLIDLIISQDRSLNELHCFDEPRKLLLKRCLKTTKKL